MGENQASPRRTLSKNWVHAVGASERKNPKRAHSTIAPPVCVSLRDVGTWQDTFLRRRRRPARSEASGTKDSLSLSLPGVRIQPHTSPVVLAAIPVRPRFTSQRFETSFLLQLWGSPQAPPKKLYAVRMGGQGLQSQDRGTWARLRGKMSSVCLLAVDGQRGSLPFQMSWAAGVCCWPLSARRCLTAWE